MPKYQVTLKETIRHTIVISAKDEETAIKKAESKFEKDPRNFDSEQDWEIPDSQILRRNK